MTKRRKRLKRLRYRNLAPIDEYFYYGNGRCYNQRSFQLAFRRFRAKGINVEIKIDPNNVNTPDGVNNFKEIFNDEKINRMNKNGIN